MSDKLQFVGGIESAYIQVTDKLKPKSTVKEWAKSVWLNIHRLLRDF